jgi:acyl-CoA thioesterase-2
MTSYPALDALTLTGAGPGRFDAGNVPSEERAVVFGGQLLGQVIVAAKATDPAKVVRQVHVVFARAGNVANPLQLSVNVLHGGRTMSSAYVTVAQGERTLCGSVVLLDSAEPDVLRETLPMPSVPRPEDLADHASRETEGSEIRFVDGVDLNSESANGPAEVALWTRWDDPGTDELAVHQALTAWFTDPYLIPAAMRPHDGIALGMSHHSLSTGVLTHTLTFHEAFDAREWLLLTQRVAFGGGGRIYGEGHAFTSDGRLVASFAQESMIRRLPPGRPGDHSTTM